MPYNANLTPSRYSHIRARLSILAHTHIWVHRCASIYKTILKNFFSNYRDFPLVVSNIITTFATSNLKNNGGKDYERI